ncbi:hypothetical protein RJT34_20369 [Clitoria ternatea]|uniref:Uncharacterized protein n=1 Tax=Clitoria ternatea TaxID=43366 RepID=A0AAN9ISP7_CLITE
MGREWEGGRILMKGSPRGPAPPPVEAVTCEDTNSEEDKDPEEEPMEQPAPAPEPELVPVPISTPIIAPSDIEMADSIKLSPLPTQLPSSKFMDIVVASLPPTIALAVEPLGMYIPDMQMEDLAPPVAPIASLMDGFLTKRQ